MRKSTYTIPYGELWEIEAPCSVQLYINDTHVGTASQREGAMKLRGSKGGTTITSWEPIKKEVTETTEEHFAKMPKGSGR